MFEYFKEWLSEIFNYSRKHGCPKCGNYEIIVTEEGDIFCSKCHPEVYYMYKTHGGI